MAKKSNTAKAQEVISTDAQEHVIEQAQQVEQTEVKQVEAIQHKLEDLMELFKTRSAVIRFLDSEGHSRGQIAKFMNIKYQFVRNVLITPIGQAK